MTEDEMVRSLMRLMGCDRKHAQRLLGRMQTGREFENAVGRARRMIDAQPVPTKDRILMYENVIVQNGRAMVPIRRNVVGIDYCEEGWACRLAAGGLRIVLPVTPRTKKNGGKGKFFGIDRKDSPYAVYRDQCREILRLLCAVLELPLPRAPYNLAVAFYVDKAGEKADRFGLEQAIADILQRDRRREFVGVVTDDHQFRTGDGTRIIFGDERPRVELTITPL